VIRGVAYSACSLSPFLTGERVGVIGANLTRTIMLSVVIVRVGGRSSKHKRSDLGRALPDPPALGLLDAPPEAGHDNREIDDLGLS
jgi:hypothetical protein